MARSARQGIGNQTVLPQFWRNCPRMMQKVNLPVKSRQSIAKKTLFLSFYSSNEGRKLDNFLAAIEVRSRTIKLEGYPLLANVSQFLSRWIQIWPIAPLCLCNCMSKMTGGTPEVRSDKSLTFGPIDQWSNELIE